LHALSSAIAPIASLTFAIDLSEIALLKLAMRVSQFEAEAVAVKDNIAESDNSSRPHILTILGSSMGRTSSSYSSTSTTTKAKAPSKLRPNHKIRYRRGKRQE
jgi:hypothetical protein